MEKVLMDRGMLAAEEVDARMELSPGEPGGRVTPAR